MIRHITSVLNEAVTALPVGSRVPFAEVVDGVPSMHAGRGQFVPVITDAAGGASYWRANGAQSVTQLDRTTACGDAVRVSIPLSLVAFVRREQCDAPDVLLNTAAHQLRSSLKAVRDSIKGAFGVAVSGVSLGVDTARSNEVRDFIVPTSLVVLTLSFVIHVDTSADCLEQCGETYDLTCTVIGRASNSKVVACLGDRVEEICGTVGPCDPVTVNRDGIFYQSVPSGGTVNVPSDCPDPDSTTVNGVESDTSAITVVRGGLEVGTLNPATGVHTVPECDPCPPCDPLLDVRLNGGRAFERVDLECGLNEYGIIVTREDGTPIGEWDPADGRIEVRPGQVRLEDSAANPIGSPVNVEPESGKTITAPDGAVSINGTPVGDVLSGGSIDVPVTLDGATASGTWTGSAYDIAKQANILREYTAGATWNKPAGLKELFVLVAGAGGGGGGAGRRNGAITGASGGGGGAVRWLRIDASLLGPTEVISIGAGGVGGPGGTVTAGTAGGNGGSTSFGSFIAAAGGTGGGTSATSGTIAGGAGGTIAGVRFFLPGGAGGQVQGNNNGSAGVNGWSQTTSGAGGGGGGAATNTPLSWAGGNGGGLFEWDGSSWTLNNGPVGPIANAGAGGNGTDDVCLHLLQSFVDIPTIGLGTGGAGGSGQSGTGGGTNNRGGNGGRAAGGGGGGAVQGGTGGNGGNGGDGFCIIIEIY